ncbi:MAG: histidine--tRNA ligase [Candidatus Doudnabacteria bacterium]|nr:histidine--tRNA ligase [Candidatus Doudnabacteria bacterium]
MTKIEPRTLKGFRDFGPEKQMARQAWFGKIQNVFESFGFLPMATPVLEYKEILMGKYGEDEKLVYSFKDNGDRDVAMRYDLTVPLARYIAENQGRLVYPFKRYQIAPVWRADNPQKGRFREFYQCDIDVVGSTAALSDAEVIACSAKALEAVGLSDYKIRLNDRRNFEVFGESASDIIRSIDKFDKIGLDGVVSELESKGVSADKIATAKQIMEGSASLQYAEQLEKLRADIIKLGISEVNIVIDPSIARGLDYYTSTVFEIVIPSMPEFGSVCSGGRYDSLVDQYSEQSVPAVGGSIGVDRLFDALAEKGEANTESVVKALIINFDEALQDEYTALATKLRAQGIAVELYYEPVKLDKQFKYAESKQIPYAIVMGTDEQAKGVVKLKNMQTREQVECSEEELIKTLS